jgi:hypothetical protein
MGSENFFGRNRSYLLRSFSSIHFRRQNHPRKLLCVPAVYVPPTPRPAITLLERTFHL